MASVEDGIAAQIRNIETAYGKPIGAWIELVNASGLTKHNEIVSMLKTDHGMRHGAAHRVALLARNADTPAPATADAAIDALFTGKRAALRPLHDKLIAAVTDFGRDIDQVPKKGYVSLRRAKQFAMIQPSTTGRLDVGLILKAHEPTDRLESAKGFNALFTHRVRIQTAADIDDELCAWLREAYQRAG
jgi:predicted transport protein